MTQGHVRRRTVAVLLLGASALVACGSDDEAAPMTVPSPLVADLVAAARETADPATHAQFDAAQPCLTETFAAYSDSDLQTLITALRTKDLANVPDDLIQQFRDDGVSCNEENRALDAADYTADAEQRIADDGRTNVRCELPASTEIGTTFACTGNFQNRTSEYVATIDAVGHVVIERTDD
jgi:hypothetical protein